MHDVPVFPLARWEIGGFRSMRDTASLDLKGLNVLVGANSAGKSSILYSILMAAQTLGNPLADRALVLNGPLARLGLAEDCVHESGDGTLHVGFTLRRTDHSRGPRGLNRVRVESCGVAANFSMKDRSSDFELCDATIEGTGLDDEHTGVVRLKVSRSSHEDAESRLQEAGLDDELVHDTAADLPFQVVNPADEKVVAAGVRQFLPESIVRVVNRFDEELRVGLEQLLYRRHWQATDRSWSLSPEVAEFFAAYLNAHNFEVPEVLHKISGAPVPFGEMASTLTAEASVHLASMTNSDWYLEHVEQLPQYPVLRRSETPDEISGAADFARRFFGHAVRHLGPLRAAPQPLYGLPEAASGDSVGRSGEYTAAVLSAYGLQIVEVPIPGYEGNRRVTLNMAVNEWMKAMSLVASVKSHEQGKFGYELHLRIEGVRRDLDLTTVGVGVSQILPVVVLGLISPPGSLVILEQPELHLHPDVQAALGDFFLALAGSGRQLLVETHSEYLINRLRRRAAETSGSAVSHLVQLFYFERHGMSSSVEPVDMTPDGGFHRWPRGFLDQASREIEAMADALQGEDE
jgi:predicted ATPase